MSEAAQAEKVLIGPVTVEVIEVGSADKRGPMLAARFSQGGKVVVVDLALIRAMTDGTLAGALQYGLKQIAEFDHLRAKMVKSGLPTSLGVDARRMTARP